ncbi:MAG: hypothetical protein GXO66_09115 [Euryarchaeota archaeon]|nr:hypothetical protein [Euryarchaeota archaeon]
MRDFTLEAYRKLCECILENFSPVRVVDYITGSCDGKVAVLRHDVDRKPENALAVARLERELGIASTFYFRTTPGVFVPEIIGEIAAMGHEVGYHYEVMDRARGDAELAMRYFEEDLERFSQICRVETICMHGNPLSPWDNRSLWRSRDFRSLGIKGDAYLSIDFSRILYFTDTGRDWSGRYSVKDNGGRRPEVESTFELMEFLKGCASSVYINTHPERWNDALLPWTAQLLTQSLKNMGKVVLKWRL